MSGMTAKLGSRQSLLSTGVQSSPVGWPPTPARWRGEDGPHNWHYRRAVRSSTSDTRAVPRAVRRADGMPIHRGPPTWDYRERLLLANSINETGVTVNYEN